MKYYFSGPDRLRKNNTDTIDIVIGNFYSYHIFGNEDKFKTGRIGDGKESYRTGWRVYYHHRHYWIDIPEDQLLLFILKWS